MKDKKDAVDVRKFDFEIRASSAADGAEGPVVLEGYAARFDQWSEDLGGFRERLKPGAFKNALRVSDVRALYNHDTNQLPLGRTPKTLRLLEDPKGLWVEIDLPDTQAARDLKISIDRKDIREMSFGFTVADDGDEWKEKDGMVSRTITSVAELYDVSPVVYPAYTSTKIAVRTAEKLNEVRAAGIGGADGGGIASGDEGANLEIDILTINRRI